MLLRSTITRIYSSPSMDQDPMHWQRKSLLIPLVDFLRMAHSWVWGILFRLDTNCASKLDSIGSKTNKCTICPRSLIHLARTSRNNGSTSITLTASQSLVCYAAMPLGLPRDHGTCQKIRMPMTQVWHSFPTTCLCKYFLHSSLPLSLPAAYNLS